MTSLRAHTMQPSRLRPLALLLLLAALGLMVLSACVREDDLTPEQRAFSLEGQLMCPVCGGQTIAESHSQLSTDMKAVVREQIAAGRTNEEIRDYFVARYGEAVLAAPEASGFNLLVWIMPAVIAGGGALAVFFVLKNMRRRSEAAAQSARPVADRQLAKYLEKVDEDIGYRTSEAAGRSQGGNELR